MHVAGYYEPTSYVHNYANEDRYPLAPLHLWALALCALSLAPSTRIPPIQPLPCDFRLTWFHPQVRDISDRPTQGATRQRGGRSTITLATSRGARVVGRCTARRNSANSPRIRITLLSGHVTSLARRLGRRGRSRRSHHNVRLVVNSHHHLLSCLGHISVGHCHSLVRHLNLHQWLGASTQMPEVILKHFACHRPATAATEKLRSEPTNGTSGEAQVGKLAQKAATAKPIRAECIASTRRSDYNSDRSPGHDAMYEGG